MCLMALKDPDETNSIYRPNIGYKGIPYGSSLLGAVEFSPNDFKGTSMANIGSDRKLYVADLAVRNDARRNGVATQLLKEIEYYALKNSYEDIYLHVEVDNIAARNMYTKLGYNEVPKYDWATMFTESRLHKSVDQYVFLWKSMVGNTVLPMANSLSNLSDCDEGGCDDYDYQVLLDNNKRIPSIAHLIKAQDE